MVAVSGHVERPGVFEIVNGTTTFRDLLYGEEFCQGIRDGHELKAFVPGGGSAPWFLPDQLDLPFEGKLVGAAGSMLGSGAIMVMDETTDIPYGRADAGPLLRPRVVRQVRAVPRGRHVAGAHPAARRRRPRRARGPRPAARGRRVDLPGRVPARGQRAARPRGRAVPVQDDDDLLRRPVGLRPGPLGADAVPRRVRGADQATACASPSPRRVGHERRRRRWATHPQAGRVRIAGGGSRGRRHRAGGRRRRRAGARAGPERRRRSRSTAGRSSARKGELVIAAAERAGDVHPAVLLAPRG